MKVLCIYQEPLGREGLSVFNKPVGVAVQRPRGVDQMIDWVTCEDPQPRRAQSRYKQSFTPVTQVLNHVCRAREKY